MGIQQRRSPLIMSSFLIISGFVMFIISYFLLPLAVTTASCIDTCTPPIHRTMWGSSLQILSSFSNFSFSTLCILVLHYLPLLAGLLMLGCSLGFLIQPRRFFVVWFYRIWFTGMSALLLILPLLIFFMQPEIGYPFLLLSYGLIFGGYRLFLGAYPEWRDALLGSGKAA
jgi:hypothetical protein